MVRRKEWVQQEGHGHTHRIILFVAAYIQIRQGISWSSTKLSTKIMAKVGTEMDNWFFANHGPRRIHEDQRMTRKGGRRGNHQRKVTVKRVLYYLGVRRGETMERRIVERKEELSYVVRTRLPSSDSVLPSLLIRNEKKENNDPLKWWRDRQTKLPILAMLARMYLCIPATSAPSERIFSMASRLINKRRARLTPENAGRIIFVNRNLGWYEEEHGLII